MSDSSLFAPLTPFAPSKRPQGFVAHLAQILGAPERWLEARRIGAELAALTEREWHDIGAGPRDPGCGYADTESADDRAARKIAARAWGASTKPLRPLAA